MGEQNSDITELEADLYDRQIRLWGLESQNRLKNANVLLIGVRALGAEVAKNILLSGIKSLTFLDDGKVEEADLLTNFLLPRESLGQNVAEAVIDRARNLNPMVQISFDTNPIKEKDEAFFKSFSIVIATRLDVNQLIKVNNICRENKIQFICGDVYGMFGYTFSDFGVHEFYEDVKRIPSKKRKQSEKPEPITVRVEKTFKFGSLQNAVGKNVKSMCKLEKISPLYFLTRVLFEFRVKFERNVSVEEKDDDLGKLVAIRDKLFGELGLSEDRLPNELLNLVFGNEVVSVCAIVGGILAQEVIKAISHKESPLDNFFFFNPLDFSGKVEKVAN